MGAKFCNKIYGGQSNCFNWLCSGPALAENDHQTKSTEDIQNQVSVVEKEIRNEIERALSAIALVEKYRENRREVERSLDLQYKREVSEALETHMNVVKREHAIISYIEQRKIRREEAQEEMLNELR